MPSADVLRRLPDGSNECRCRYCGEIFLAGGPRYWCNHFYCSEQCGHKANERGTCGENRNFCDCRKEAWDA